MGLLTRSGESVANSPRLFFKPRAFLQHRRRRWRSAHCPFRLPSVPSIPPSRPENCPRHDLTFCTSGAVLVFIDSSPWSNFQIKSDCDEILDSRRALPNISMVLLSREGASFVFVSGLQRTVDRAQCELMEEEGGVTVNVAYRGLGVFW